MLRAVLLSLIVMFSIAVTIPLTMTTSAHGTNQAASQSQRSWRRRQARLRRKRAWWRRHRAALLRRRRQMAARQSGFSPVAGRETVSPGRGGVYTDPRGMVNLTLPAGWDRAAVNGSETKFTIRAADGRPVGTAALAPVNLSAQAASGATLVRGAGRRTLAGVPFAALRRTIIDKIVMGNGFVVNDAEREIGGRRVFAVVTSSSADQSSVYYFTEIDGRLYCLEVSAPSHMAVPLAQQTEQVIASFRAVNTPTGPAIASGAGQ
jgi:hypothetical protein